MNLNENTDESAIVIWVTALEGASFETYRNAPRSACRWHPHSSLTNSHARRDAKGSNRNPCASADGNTSVASRLSSGFPSMKSVP